MDAKCRCLNSSLWNRGNCDKCKKNKCEGEWIAWQRRRCTFIWLDLALLQEGSEVVGSLSPATNPSPELEDWNAFTLSCKCLSKAERVCGGRQESKRAFDSMSSSGARCAEKSSIAIHIPLAPLAWSAGKRGRRWLFIFIGIRLFTQSERNVRKWRTCEGFGAPSPRGSWPWDRVSPLLGSAKETTVLRDVNGVFVYHFESISNLVLSVNGQKCSPLLGSDKFNT